MLQVGTITYLMITDTILILYLETTAYTGYKGKIEEDMFSTMAQMAHFSFPYYFTIPNSEFRIPKFALRISEFGIRNCEVYVVWASGNS